MDRPELVRQEDFEQRDNVYQIGVEPRRIDILTSITGVDWAEAWSSRTFVDAAGMRLAVLGRDALAKNKRATGREKDLVDVKALERLTKK